jgi:cytosol alanyl aminopeptidase
MPIKKILPLLSLLYFIIQIAAADDIPAGRLPSDVRPLSYDLNLTVDPSADGFSGIVKIQIELEKPASVLWIHGRDLRATKSEVALPDGQIVSAKYEQANKEGVVRLELPKAIGPGKAEIHIEYEGTYGKTPEGIYKVEESGSSYVFTQFESIDARRCFPGFDEPAFKTPFEISLTVKANEQAVTNTMPSKEEPMSNGMKHITFQRTANLPTYLIAFAVGPLDIVKGKEVPPSHYRKEAIPVRGVALKGKGSQMKYAVAHAGEFLTILENYFQIAYPYGKMDIIAIPGFGGAMENAGAVTFGEDLLLFDEKTASINQKRGYASVVAHEFAHQWFGDMVTMPWWDDIWLNEAFATWMEAKVLQEWHPAYRSNISELQSGLYAMHEDTLISARQIRQPIKSTDDIYNAFDTITYSKGGAVLQMFEDYSTPEAFQKGIHFYLNKYKSQTATTDDFLAAVSEGSGKSIAEHFHTFLFQPGVPFISVTAQCNNGKSSVTLEQKRYLPLGSKGSADSTWHVPVGIKFALEGKSQEKYFLLTDPKASFDLTTSGCPEWIMPNADGGGYYKWTMPPDDMEKLRSSAMRVLTVREQLSLADSVMGGFENGTLHAAEVLRMLEPFANSNDRFVVTQPMDILEFFRDHFADQESYKKVQEYGRKLYAPLYSRLGFMQQAGANNDEDERFLRTDTIYFLGLIAEDPDVRNKAKQMALSADPTTIDPDIRETVLTVGVQDSDASFTKKLEEDFKKSTDQQLKDELLSAIGWARDPGALNAAREMVFDPALHSTEFFQLLERLSYDPRTLDTEWKWVVNDFDRISALIPKGDVFLAGALPFLGYGFCSQEKADELKAFFEPKVAEMPGAPRNLAKVVERIELCSARLKNQAGSAREYFAQKVASN